MDFVEINFLGIEENELYKKIIEKTLKTCYEEENMMQKNLYTNIVLTTPQEIRKINKQCRNIDKETDVLSFPMFEKEELRNINIEIRDVLGDIVISIEKVRQQAIEYGHSFERELAYMVVHGFYHIMGYDHMKENDKIEMRKKEEMVLEKLPWKRNI